MMGGQKAKAKVERFNFDSSDAFYGKPNKRINQKIQFENNSFTYLGEKDFLSKTSFFSCEHRTF